MMRDGQTQVADPFNKYLCYYGNASGILGPEFCHDNDDSKHFIKLLLCQRHSKNGTNKLLQTFQKAAIFFLCRTWQWKSWQKIIKSHLIYWKAPEKSFTLKSFFLSQPETNKENSSCTMRLKYTKASLLTNFGLILSDWVKSCFKVLFGTLLSQIFLKLFENSEAMVYM